MVRPGLTVVVSPLIALMKDQVDSLRANGVAAAGLHSGLDREALLECYAELRRGDLKLLYVAPERLLMADFLARLAELPLAMFAIDDRITSYNVCYTKLLRNMASGSSASRARKSAISSRSGATDSSLRSPRRSSA